MLRGTLIGIKEGAIYNGYTDSIIQDLSLVWDKESNVLMAWGDAMGTCRI